MIKRYLLWAGLGFTLIFPSCQPSSYPPCLEKPETLLHKKMRQVVDLVDESYAQTYRYEAEGNKDKADKQWNRILAIDSLLFRQLSLTNIFESEGGLKEYYALEMSIDLGDTLHRQSLLDYQFTVDEDTAMMVRADEREIRYTGISVDGAYLLEGYAHKGNPFPEQYRWWSPESGDLVIWYGEERFFVLQSPSDEKTQELIEGLKAYFRRFTPSLYTPSA